MQIINKYSHLLKSLLILISYFIYDIVISQILYIFNISNTTIVDLISDIIYFLFIMVIYRNKIRNFYLSFFNKHNFKESFLFIMKWVVILYCTNFIGGILTQIIFPNLGLDANTEAIYSLYETATYYTIFKIVLFSTIVESIIYIEVIKNIINNKTLFIVVSSVFYGLMNIAYANMSLVTVIDFIQSCLMALVLSYIYVKNNDNVVAVMLVKLVYNLIPLAFLILSVFNIS